MFTEKLRNIAENNKFWLFSTIYKLKIFLQRKNLYSDSRNLPKKEAQQLQNNWGITQ